MKKHPRQQPSELVQLRLWTYEEAKKGVPYLRSLVASLREKWLAARQSHRELELISKQSGRAKRADLIQLEESNRNLDQAGTQLEEVMDEMMAISLYSVDPTAGVAVIPFIHEESLAWFVFDLFDPRGLVAWRGTDDNVDSRRSLAELGDLPEPRREEEPPAIAPSMN